uniref:Ubiquitin-like domain-containing protein n=1 Tax=Pyrodinium bahamense TaxID=73915 RepID=A0A7S0BDA1_9DINO|eukprot:CAMPEP_0179025178 /NCGR_PEP_ID=MMETSP0796-20121207/7845_1 /TAXON_ID=73915 /ORGANISM="Pyrodinium bahamense, Strain pbaha01" /LENGTH=196 /DNA_ID=CAMNT_0020721179 /DNA_START=63 /DNA_END=653 /DNA_ORIENTATION=+
MAEGSAMQLRITMLSGDAIDFSVESTATISQVKDDIEKACGIPALEQELALGDKTLASTTTVGACGGRGPSGEPLALTLVRRKPLVLLCEESLKQFVAKNLSSKPIQVTLPGSRPQTIVPGESWVYGTPDLWDGRYFDLDFTNGGGVSEGDWRGNRYILSAASSSCSQEWKLRLEVNGDECYAVIEESPPEVLRNL